MHSSDSEKNSSAHVEGDATIGGDYIGRDKIEGDQYNANTINITNVIQSAQKPVAEKEKLAFEPLMCAVAAGTFLMGDPPEEIFLPAFHMGKFCVTNRQYASFLKQTDHRPPQYSDWVNRKPKKMVLDHPVRNVSWEDADTYCRWLAAETGRPYRLPTVAEWEKAARGPDGLRYPWGNDWDEQRLVYGNQQTVPAYAHEDGASPYGCVQMLGNVFEWTSTIWGSDWKTPEFSLPYRPDDREDDEVSKTFRILRGNLYPEEKTGGQLTCTTRIAYYSLDRNPQFGFRAAY